MIIGHLSDAAGQWAERGAYLFAGVAAVSLSQAALSVTIVAGLISIILGAIRIYDRLKHGRGQ